MLQTDAELQMQVPTNSPLVSAGSAHPNHEFISFHSFLISSPQDCSQRRDPAQRLHAAHAGTATRSEPLPGAARSQRPLGERHATRGHRVLGRGSQEATEGETDHSDLSDHSTHAAANPPALACSATQVIFDGEEAVDAGGVTKEFFLLLLKELMDPVYGMFTHYKDSNLLWFSDKVSHS